MVVWDFFHQQYWSSIQRRSDCWIVPSESFGRKVAPRVSEIWGNPLRWTTNIFFEEPCYQVHVEDVQTQNVCVFFRWPVIIGTYMNWRWVTDDDPLRCLRRLELEKQIRKFLGQFYPCFFRKLVIWRHEHVCSFFCFDASGFDSMLWDVWDPKLM